MVAEKSEKSRAITYAAVSAALGTILLTAGAYTGIGEFFWYFAAGVCVMITFPLKSLMTCFLSFVVCSLLSLLTTGFNVIFLLPYLVFFGAYPVSLYIEERYSVNKWVMIAITFIWFSASLYVMYLFTKLFIPETDFIKDNIFIFLFAGGTLIFFLYRFVMKRIQCKMAALAKRLKV